MSIFFFLGTALLQMMLLNRYFSILSHKPNQGKPIIFSSYILSGGILFTISAFTHFPPLLTGLLSLTSAFLIAWLYPIRLETKFIFSFLYLALGFIAESLSYYIVLIIHQESIDIDLTILEKRLFVLLMSIFVMFLFLLIIRFIKKGVDYKIGRTYYFIMTAVILISLFILNTLFFHTEKNPLYVLSVAGMLIINVLIIFMFDKMIETFRLRDEKELLQKQMTYQDSSYEKAAHSYKSIKRIIHDINKQLIYIKDCIQDNQLQEGIRHINQTLHQIKDSYIRVTTGNLVIDALVSHALNIASDSRIHMTHDIQIHAADIRLDRYDLCVVIGNVLDNAIEAAQRVPKPEDKFIRLRMVCKNQSLAIHVTNSRLVSSEQTLKTKKENPDFHGIGLTNVQRVAEKYGGYLQTEVKNKQFETIVLLPFEG